MCVCSGLKAERQAEQPDLSNLQRGNFRGFSIERLTLMLTAFGQDVEVVVRPAPHFRKQGGIRLNMWRREWNALWGQFF